MKQTCTILSLFLFFFLTNCAPKEAFMFSDFPAGQGVKPMVKPEPFAGSNTDSLSKEQVVFLEAEAANSGVLTASTVSLPLVKVGTIPKKVSPVNFKAASPAKKLVSKSAISPVKILKLRKAMLKQLKAQPDDGSKPVNKLARIGFILILLALGFYLLALITSVGVLSTFGSLTLIGGFVTSIIGLKQINRNPDRYAGKRKAKVGIAIGSAFLLVLLLGIGILLAVAAGL